MTPTWRRPLTGGLCIRFTPGLITDDGAVTNEGTEAFLTNFMAEFRDHTERVLTVLPRR